MCLSLLVVSIDNVLFFEKLIKLIFDLLILVLINVLIFVVSFFVNVNGLVFFGLW